jgi:peptidoglycan LD-endopeptidase CwlK
MSSRKIEDCSIPMQAALAEFELELRGEDIEFVRACTYRSYGEQEMLWAKGRTVPGRIITNAKGGQSPHNDMLDGQPASNAADYYPLVAGKIISDETDAELALWKKIGQIASRCGLEWGGDWVSRKIDRPHVQLPRKARP